MTWKKISEVEPPKDIPLMLGKYFQGITGDHFRVYAECHYQEAGVISEDAFWFFWDNTDFSEVINPEYWDYLPAEPEEE